MRYYDAETLRAVADLPALIDALEAGHRQPKPEMADGLIGPDHSRYLIRSAHNGKDLVGSKLVTIMPDNPGSHGLPGVQAVIMLFDGTTGKPAAALEATELTYWKTAADSALGSKFLSRRDSLVLVIAGAGGLSPWLVRGHFAVRPDLERVLVWNRTSQKADDLAHALAGEGFPAEPANNLESAVRIADIVSTATMATEPFLEGAWLKPGTHVDLVGGYSRGTREADDDVVTRGRLFVDCLESALDGVGDILQPLENRIIDQGKILGDLFDLAGGRVKAREAEQDITVFKNAGGAHLDLMVAQALIERIGHEAS